MDFAKELFSGESEKKPKVEEVDFAKELFSGKAETEPETPVGGAFYAPTGKEGPTLASYGDPRKAFAMPKEAEAGMLAQIKASFVDDPLSKIKIFADTRKISPTRYRQNPKTGQIEFKDDSGAWQREVFELPSSKAKSMFSELALDPKVYLGTAGAALAGTPGAVGGTMLGEIGRKAIGKGMSGESINLPQDLLDVGLAGALAFGGEMVGKSIGWGINKYLRSGQGIMGKVVQPIVEKAPVSGEKVIQNFITPQEQAKALWIQHIADQHGMELAPHQLYDKQGMTNIWKYLRQHPLTSDTVRTFEDQLAKASDDSLQKFIQQMGGTQQTAFKLGTEVKEAATQRITSEVSKRESTTRPLYKKAFSQGKTVDTSEAISEVDRLLGETVKGDPSHAALNRVKKMLEEAAGDPTKLDRVKRAGIDDVLNRTGTSRTLTREMKLVKDKLTSAMDEQLPEYAAARTKYAEMSKPVDRLRESIIGELSNLESDKAITQAPQRLLDLKNMPDAELVKNGFKELDKVNPELKRKVVGGYIRDTYESLKVTEEGKVVNAVGKLQKRLFGSEKQRQIMKAAMNPQDYKTFEDLMTIFQRAAIGTGKESMTAPFQAIGEKLEPMLGSKAYQFLNQPKKSILDWSVGIWNDVLVQGRQSDLMKALTSPEAIRQIGELKKLTPGSRKFIEAFSVLAMRVGQEYEQKTP